MLFKHKRCEGEFSFILCIIAPLSRFFCIRECIEMFYCVDDLLTCLFIRMSPVIYSRIIPRIKTHRAPMPFTRSSLRFPATTRYAKDPVFNIVLLNRSPSTILSTGEMPD